MDKKRKDIVNRGFNHAIALRVIKTGLNVGEVVISGDKKINPVFLKVFSDRGGVGLSMGMPVGDGIVNFIETN